VLRNDHGSRVQSAKLGLRINQEKKQEAQLTQRECTANIALLYGAKGASIC